MTAIVLVFAVSASLMQNMHETNTLDREKTRQSIQSAFALRLDRMAHLAEDNAFWDDAASAVSGEQPDIEFMDRNWGSASETATNYTAVYVVSRESGLLYGHVETGRDERDLATHYGPAFTSLLAKQQQSGGAVGGLVRDDEGLSLLGVDEIRPLTNNTDGKAGTGVYLILIKKLDGSLLAEIAQILQLTRLTSDVAAGTDTLELYDTLGNPISRLGWQGPNRSVEALLRSLPFIAITLAAAFLIVWQMARQGFNTIRQLEHLALSDGLSRLPNRRAFLVRLEEAMSGNKPVAVAVLDLDGFKAINDNYGHSIGDKLIEEFSSHLSSNAQPDVYVARLSGDEFALMACGTEGSSRLREIGGKLLETMRCPFRVGDRTISIGVSIGIADHAPGFSSSDLLRRADIAMYACKTRGKMQLGWYDADLDAAQARQFAVENALRAALSNGEFEILYQPLVSRADGRIVSVEALLRWESASLGQVSPAEFIPIAEASGLIDAVGLHVLTRACAQARDWPQVKTAVNVSAAQLRNPEFAGMVEQILRETGLPASQLEIEITETYLVHDPDTASRTLAHLRGLGVEIALDDFGSGYASIGFLRQFGFTKLKIDRSLVEEIAGNRPAQAIIRASMDVARALDMKVAAEGIETPEQDAFMRLSGCDQLQGWFYFKAVPAARLEQLIAAESIDQERNTERYRRPRPDVPSVRLMSGEHP